MAVNRVVEVNRALKARGVEERLKRGKGYYYFIHGEAHTWYTSSVPVCHASSLSVAQWLAEYDQLKSRVSA